MASYEFVKPHRRLPNADTWWGIVKEHAERWRDVTIVVATVTSNILSDWIEDDAARVVAWAKRKRRRS